MDVAPLEQTLLRQIIRDGGVIPDKFLKVPELRPGLALYLEAFFDLDSDRVFNNAPGRIGWSSIKDYCEYLELDEDASYNMAYFIRQLDEAHLARINRKLKADHGKRTARPGRANGKGRGED